MFPYRDENETQRTPFINIAVIVLNVLVWLFVEGAGASAAVARAVCDLGLIPGELTGMLPPGTRFPMGEGLVCLTDPVTRQTPGQAPRARQAMTDNRFYVVYARQPAEPRPARSLYRRAILLGRQGRG